MFCDRVSIEIRQLAIRLSIALLTFFIGVTVAIPWSAHHHAAPVSNMAAQDILKMDREYFNAHMQRDASTLDHLLADDFTFGLPFGKAANKAYRLALLENPDLAFLSIDTQDVDAHVNKDKGFVTGQARVRGHYQGQLFISPLYRFTHMYERRQGRWQIVAAQVTRIQ